MRTDNAAFNARLKQHDVGLVRLWTITGQDGIPHRFTDHDTDLTINDDTYVSAISFTASSTLRATGSNSQGMTITTYLIGGESDIGLTEQAIRAGNYDGALAEVLLFLWDAPELGTFSLFTGQVGTTDISNEGALVVDIDRATAGGALTLETYSASCRADFGDERCKYPIENHRRDFTVTTTLGDRQTFTCTEVVNYPSNDPINVDFFKYGTLVFDTGKNAGVAIEVMNTALDGTVVLFLQMPFEIVEGDTGRLWPGCDKQFQLGCTRWNNKLNFRGEPGFQDLTPTAVVDPTVDPEQPVGTWKGWFVPQPNLPGNGFFWALQYWYWDGADPAPSRGDQGQQRNSVGGGGFPIIEGQLSVNGGQNPYTTPNGIPDPVRKKR